MVVGACTHAQEVVHSRSKHLEFKSQCWEQVLSKLLIPCCLHLPSSNGYLVKWKMLNGRFICIPLKFLLSIICFLIDYEQAPYDIDLLLVQSGIPLFHRDFGSSFTRRKQRLFLLVTYGRLLCHSLMNLICVC